MSDLTLTDHRSAPRSPRPRAAHGGAAGRGVLLLAGVVALAVGGAELLVPVAFEGSVGLDLAGQAAALSETRGGGGGLLGVGALLLAGAARPSLTRAAALLGALVYAGYALGRALSWGVDGGPGAVLLGAGLAEVVLATACGVLLLRRAAAPVLSDHTG